MRLYEYQIVPVRVTVRVTIAFTHFMIYNVINQGGGSMAKRANGEGSWQVKTIKNSTYQVYRIAIDGKQKSFYGKTKKEAFQKYKQYSEQAELETENKDDSFYQYCHNWLFEWRPKNIKQTTFDYYDSIIDLYIKDTKLGNLLVKNLNNLTKKEAHSLFQKHIDQFRDKSKSTSDGIYTVLNQVCAYGVKYQDFALNPMEQITKLTERDVKTKKKEIKALDYSEVMKLWNEMNRKNEEGAIINGKPGTYVYGVGSCALLFCCFTGLRWGEVTRLQWEDIQNDNGKMYFKVDKQFVRVKNRDKSADIRYTTITETPKSEKSNRYIPLNDKAVQVLELVKERFPECYKPNHIIFSSTGNPYNESTANRLLRVMCIRAGIHEVSPHALRHSFASILLNEDEKNLYAVSDLLGHSSSDVTYKRYIDIFEKNKVNTINIFNDISAEE